MQTRSANQLTAMVDVNVATIEVIILFELGGKVMKGELLNVGVGLQLCLFFIWDFLHDFENSWSYVKLLHIHVKLWQPSINVLWLKPIACLLKHWRWFEMFTVVVKAVGDSDFLQCLSCC